MRRPGSHVGTGKGTFLVILRIKATCERVRRSTQPTGGKKKKSIYIHVYLCFLDPFSMCICPTPNSDDAYA